MWCVCFFFKQKTAYEMRISDWSSDVCSSDLVLAVLGQRHVHVHARTVVTDDRLRHEGRRLAELMGDVLHDVLQLQDFVSLLGQRTELDADLALAGSRDFMMVHFEIGRASCRERVCQYV